MNLIQGQLAVRWFNRKKAFVRAARDRSPDAALLASRLEETTREILATIAELSAPEPWPFVREGTAANMLEISVKEVVALANNPIPAVRRATKAGNAVWIFQKSAVLERVQ